MLAPVGLFPLAERIDTLITNPVASASFFPIGLYVTLRPLRSGINSSGHRIIPKAEHHGLLPCSLFVWRWL